MNVFAKIGALVFVAVVVTSCAAENAVIKERYVWPAPPNPPRIEWLGAYSSQLDLKMTAFRRLKESVVGEDAPIALRKPLEVKADGLLDKMYVSDFDAGGVYVYDIGQGELRMISNAKAGIPGRIIPGALALDGSSNLYILEPRARMVFVYSSSEDYMRSISLKSSMQRPVALAIDKVRERLYVSDVVLNRIFVFDLNGNKLLEFGEYGFEEGKFNKPVAMAITAKGNVIVADSFNARIQIFDNSGKFIRAFGSRGDGAGSFQLIKSVAVDQDDNIYVADGRSHSVSIFNLDGQLLQIIGSFYAISQSGKVAPGGFALPSSIDIDSRGRIFVVDQMNARIQCFQYLSEAQSGAQQVSGPDKVK